MATKSRSTRVSGLAGGGFLLLFTLFWSIGVLGFDFVIGRSVVRQIYAVGYPTATGTITQSEVETIRGRRSRTYRPTIKYKYTVEGQEYVGERYRYGQFSSAKKWAERIVASHPVGSPFEVYYAPTDPSDAVLTVGLEGLDLFIFMFMLPFNVVMLAFWIAGGGEVLYRLSPGPAGGAKLCDDGRYVRVRLSMWKPLYSGLAAAGALAFVGIFIMAFGFGHAPPLPVTLVAWGVIVGSGALAYTWHWRKLSGGDSDLVLDTFNESITLPHTFNRPRDSTIRAKKVVAIEVEKVEKRGTKGGVYYSYVPTLIFTDNDGSRRREKIAEWSSEARAEGLASWLREKLRIKPPSESTLTSEWRS